MPMNQNTGRTWREGNDGAWDRDESRSETMSGRSRTMTDHDRDRDVWDRERNETRSFNEYGRDDDDRDFSYGSRYDRDVQNRWEQRDRVLRGETGSGGMERIRNMRSELGERGIGGGVAYERAFDRNSYDRPYDRSFDRGSFDRGMGQSDSFFDRSSSERSSDRDRHLGFGFSGSQYSGPHYGSGSQYGQYATGSQYGQYGTGSQYGQYGTGSQYGQYGTGSQYRSGSQYGSGAQYGSGTHIGSQASRTQQHYAPQYGSSAYGSQFGFGSSSYGTEGAYGHRGKGPRNFIRSDERVREIVCETLADDDRVDASDIDVVVRDGEVILSGTVHDRRSKRIAEDIVEELRGVKDVQNQIRVMRGDPRETNIDQLNSFLRGELSAVETYRMALDKLDKGSPARTELETCMRSHEERVQMLREQIRRLGGTPSTSSGAWGVFAKVVEGGARALGDKAAIAALEEGEDHGLRDYRDNVDKLDRDMRNIVSTRLLAEQENTHSRMSSLKKRLQS